MRNTHRMHVILVWNEVLACIIEQKISQDEDESPYDWTTVKSALSTRIIIFWTSSNLQLSQSFNMFCMPIENWMCFWTELITSVNFVISPPIPSGHYSIQNKICRLFPSDTWFIFCSWQYCEEKPEWNCKSGDL